MKNRPRRTPGATRQHGQAALIIVLLLGVGVAAFVYAMATPARNSIERDKITAAALAQAKAALIGYAVSVDLTGTKRPGDLPCPDINNNGEAGGSCSNAGGTTLGRLPWKTLGLPDLRDGNGERLWYAVSNNFKNNPRTSCSSPGEVGCLNSDSRGTITVRNRNGVVINDGANPDSFIPSGVIAVIIAPGAVLQRQGSSTPQDRSCTVGVDCTDAGQCTTSPTTLTPRCNPVNYLDTLSGTDDNAAFVDGSSTDGFIQGDVLDTGGNVIVNDRLIAITYQDLMPLLERRVAKEALNCLTAYAAMPQNNGRYPWAAPIANVTPPYADAVNTRFGRLPDTFSDTLLGVGGAVASLVCTVPNALCMSNSWPASCSITSGSWWTNWKEIVFYGVAQAYQPADPISIILGVSAGGPCGSCLTVNPPSSSTDKQVVVIVSGKRLSTVSGGQLRTTVTDKSTVANYLEGENDWTLTSSDIFAKQSIGVSFNDTVQYK